MALASDLRSGVKLLSDGARRDLAALWRQVESASQARVALNDILPALVDQYGDAAAAMAAVWYDDLRAKQGIAGRFTSIPAVVGDTGTGGLVAWALDTATDYMSFQTLIEGGTQKRIANVARSTVMGSSVADPRADGWQRVSSGGCAFCQMLAGRATLYRSEDSATFASHEFCDCAAVPAFGGEELPVKPYTPTSRNITDADRARVREYLASH